MVNTYLVYLRYFQNGVDKEDTILINEKQKKLLDWLDDNCYLSTYEIIITKANNAIEDLT